MFLILRTLLLSAGNPGPGPANYNPCPNLTKEAAPQYSIVGKPKKKEHGKTRFDKELWVYFNETVTQQHINQRTLISHVCNYHHLLVCKIFG